MNYHRLCPSDREHISRLLAQGTSITDIAAFLGRNKSTISREVARIERSGRRYAAFDAQADADRKMGQRRSVRKLDAVPELLSIVKEKLARRWSPEQISAFLRKTYPEDHSMQVSHETIYTYLYVLPRGELRKELIAYLRRKHPTRRRRTQLNDRRGVIPEMISIDERPAEVADRSIAGHWEGDLIMGVGNRSAIGTLVERTTRTVVLVPLSRKDATSVRRAFAREIRKLPQQLAQSLTYDQGREMAEHRLFTAETKMKVYFAHPHSPWERGTNENTNGLIRDYFPKGTDFSQISRREIKRVQKELNERPRKVLNWDTPVEAMTRLLSSCSSGSQ
jgi:IS30 family transposase